MKRMPDIFCNSPASTAICTSLDHRSMVRHGSRSLNNHTSSKLLTTCSSQLPFNPKSYYDSRRSSSKKDYSRRNSSVDVRDIKSSVRISKDRLQRKSSADITDIRITSDSSRYLLSDSSSSTPYIDWIATEYSDSSDDKIGTMDTRLAWSLHKEDMREPRNSSSVHVSALVPDSPQVKLKQRCSYESPARKSSSLVCSNDWVSVSRKDFAVVTSTPSSKPSKLTKSNDSPALRNFSSVRSSDQVVVLWVSIHCKGCEQKVRRHISKMEGVRSFTIDLATKKVTITGNVTPLGVLASVSKVKNAHLWSSTTSPSPRWST